MWLATRTLRQSTYRISGSHHPIHFSGATVQTNEMDEAALFTQPSDRCEFCFLKCDLCLLNVTVLETAWKIFCSTRSTRNGARNQLDTPLHCQRCRCTRLYRCLFRFLCLCKCTLDKGLNSSRLSVQSVSSSVN